MNANIKLVQNSIKA